MALSLAEVALIERHKALYDKNQNSDELMLRYYLGRQRLEQLTLLRMVVPPSMREFTTIANWSRVLVDTKDSRQQVRALILPGEDKADPQLRAILDATNFDAHLSMFNRDRMIYGRAFMSVGSNEANESLPLIRVESPREMTAIVDVRTEVMRSACRFYGTDENGSGPTNVTLLLPNETIWVARDAKSGRWGEVDRDVHNLGVVPVIMHLNRRRSGGWVGESELTDLIPIVDAAAANLTFMQFAQAAHGAPRIYMTGVAKGDFIDKDGKPIPQFEAYWNALHTLTNPQAKMGQIPAADLKNFETAMDIYGRQASILTGFPARYFGLATVNPPSEGSIRADESQLVRSVESDNVQLGISVGWVGALALRFASGEWVQGNKVRSDFHDPATPTVAQREDALSKRKAQGVLSVRGYMTELGWSEARIQQELDWLAEEASSDPVIAAARALSGA